MTCDELIAALEAATGPSRELDYEVAGFFGLAVQVQVEGMDDVAWKRFDGSLSCTPHRYTASTEAALMLARTATDGMAMLFAASHAAKGGDEPFNPWPSVKAMILHALRAGAA